MRFLERWTLDRPLFFGILMLSAFGIAMIYSAGQVSVPNVVTADAWVRQVQWLIIALVVFSAVSRIPVRWIVWAALPSYVISVVLLALTLVIGEGRGTAATQDFHADAYTADLVPTAATNIWTVEVHPGETFAYALRREGRRFRVEFDLTAPIDAPPAPWGG